MRWLRLLLGLIAASAAALALTALWLFPELSEGLTNRATLSITIPQPDGSNWQITDQLASAHFNNFSEGGDCAVPAQGYFLLRAPDLTGPDGTQVDLFVEIYDFPAPQGDTALASDNIMSIVLQNGDSSVRWSEIIDPDETFELDVTGGGFLWRFSGGGTQMMRDFKQDMAVEDLPHITLTLRGHSQATTAQNVPWPFTAFCLQQRLLGRL